MLLRVPPELKSLDLANEKANEFAKAANSNFTKGKHEISAKPTQVNGKHTFIVEKGPPIQIPLSSLVLGLFFWGLLQVFHAMR